MRGPDAACRRVHNLLCGPVSRQRELLGLLRYLGNDLRIPIVALGTRDAYLALRLDDQLENRFQRSCSHIGVTMLKRDGFLPARVPTTPAGAVGSGIA